MSCAVCPQPPGLVCGLCGTARVCSAACLLDHRSTAHRLSTGTVGRVTLSLGGEEVLPPKPAESAEETIAKLTAELEREQKERTIINKAILALSENPEGTIAAQKYQEVLTALQASTAIYATTLTLLQAQKISNAKLLAQNALLNHRVSLIQGSMFDTAPSETERYLHDTMVKVAVAQIYALKGHFSHLIGLLGPNVVTFTAPMGLVHNTEVLLETRRLPDGLVPYVANTTMALYQDVYTALLTYAALAPVCFERERLRRDGMHLSINSFINDFLGYGSYGIAVTGTLTGIENPNVVIRFATNAPYILDTRLLNEMHSGISAKILDPRLAEEDKKKEEVPPQPKVQDVRTKQTRSFKKAKDTIRLSTWIYQYLYEIRRQDATLETGIVKIYGVIGIDDLLPDAGELLPNLKRRVRKFDSVDSFNAGIVIMEKMDIDLRQFIECVLTDKEILAIPTSENLFGKRTIAAQVRADEPRTPRQKTDTMVHAIDVALEAIATMHKLGLLHADTSQANVGLSWARSGGRQLVAKLFDMDFAAMRPGLYATELGTYGERDAELLTRNSIPLQNATKYYFQDARTTSAKAADEYIQYRNFTNYYNRPRENLLLHLERIWTGLEKPTRTRGAEVGLEAKKRMDARYEGFLWLFSVLMAALGIELHCGRKDVNFVQQLDPKLIKHGKDAERPRWWAKEPNYATDRFTTTINTSLGFTLHGFYGRWEVMLKTVRMEMLDHIIFFLHLFELLTTKKIPKSASAVPWENEIAAPYQDWRNTVLYLAIGQMRRLVGLAALSVEMSKPTFNELIDPTDKDLNQE